MAINFFIVDTSKILPSDYKYCIIFYPNCLVLELFHSEHSLRPPSWIDFQKIIFTGHDLSDVRCRENQNNKYILLCVYRDFVLLVRNLAVFDYLNRKYSR